MHQKDHHKEKQDNLKGNLIQYKSLQYEKYDSMKNDSIDGKKVIVETDRKFIKSIDAITKTKESVLDEIMKLSDNPLDEKEIQEIHFRARRHLFANIVNVNTVLSKDMAKKQTELEDLYCHCGCQRFQGKNFQMNCKLEDMSILGSGILLYFFLLKSIAKTILIFVCIQNIFALVTNLMGSEYLNLSSNCTSSYCYFRDQASNANKYNANYLTYIQGWLGLAGMIIWTLIARYAKIEGKIMNDLIDLNLDSASDYSIQLGNLPYSQYNEDQLLEYINGLWYNPQKQQEQNQRRLYIEKQLVSKMIIKVSKTKVETDDLLRVNQSQTSDLHKGLQAIKQVIVPKTVQKMNIKSIQIIYNMEFSRKLLEKIFDICKDIKSCYKKVQEKKGLQKFVIKNKDQYIKLKSQLIQTYEMFEDLRKKFLSDSKFRKTLATRVAIIQFRVQTAKDILLEHYGKQKLTLFKEIKEHLLAACFTNSSNMIFKGRLPQLQRAPQPSDIIWQNCEKKQSIWRTLFILFVTLIIILISLGIIAGLQIAQNTFSNDPGAANSSVTTVINILISLVMIVINSLLWIVLQIVLKYEYCHTSTSKIVSLMTKSIIAMWINIIVLPIVVNYVFVHKYYNALGLSGIVYDYHVSSITVGLTMKLVDPLNMLKRVGTNIKCIRNWIIKAKFQKRNQFDKIQEDDMKNVYKFYEAPQFTIAEYYTYILSNIMHAFFYCQLQPILLIFALVEVIYFYWICKFKILKFCQIPKLTQRLIFEVANYVFMLAPVFYGVGSIFNSYVTNLLYPEREFNYIAPSICIFIGVWNFSNPMGSFQRLFKRIFCCLYPTQDEKRLHQLKQQDRRNEKNYSGNAPSHEAKNKRYQTYYKLSNSLTLLGFQNFLFNSLNNDEISKQLQDYCSSHVEKYRQQMEFQED